MTGVRNGRSATAEWETVHTMGEYLGCSIMGSMLNYRDQPGPLPLTIIYIVIGYSDDILTEYEKLDEVNRTEWCELLKSFSNVKAPRLNDGLVIVLDLSRCLRSDDGGLPPDVLLELQKLTYSGIGDTFASCINPRENAGNPINLTHRFNSRKVPACVQWA
jgi:hypothetical protein